MDQVIQNLWLGDISSVLDVENLEKNNIHSILSAMRGRVRVQAVRVSHKAARGYILISPADLHPQADRNRRS
jgi:hypothetical protein